MKSRLLIWLFVVVFLYVYLNLFKNALIDDAFITMSYVRTILRSGTWGFFPGHITNTATSPLNVLLLALIGSFIGLTPETPILLALICLCLITFMLTHISKHMFGVENLGYLAAVAFIFNPLVISTIGLESILYATIFITAIYCYLTSRWYLLAVVLGLLTITRADGIICFIIFLMVAPKTKLRFRFITTYLLCIAPWYIFSWIYLGSLIPDTFFIKKMQVSWNGWSFLTGGILYFQSYHLETILSLVFLPLLLFIFNKVVRKSPIISIIALIGFAHFLGYSLLQIPPYHWYYVPEITTIILLGSLGLGIVYQSFQLQQWQRKVVQGILIIFLLIPPLGIFHLLATKHFDIEEMPIHTNWATYKQYKNVGLLIKKRTAGKTVLLRSGEIGTLAYYCDCYLLDPFSNRIWMKKLIDTNAVGTGIGSMVFRVNFLFFTENQEFPPYSYILTEYTDRSLSNPVGSAQQWEITSKWIAQGLITFASTK